MVTIRVRVFLAFSIIYLVGLGYLVHWLVEDLRPRYLEALEESLVDQAVVLSALVERDVQEGQLDPTHLRLAFQGIRGRRFEARIYDWIKRSVDLRVYVTDQQGIVLFDSEGRAEGEDYSRWNDVHLTLLGRYGARSTRLDPDDPATSILHVAAPILVQGVPAGVLTVCKPTTGVHFFLRAARRKVMAAGLLAGLAVVFLGYLTSLWVTIPLRKLTAHARAIRDGRRVEAPRLGRSEVGLLGGAMEEMRSALEGKEYVQDYVQILTHALKGPLSSIRGAAELMEEEIPEERRARFLENVRSETERIQQIADQLLVLASLENRRALTEAKELDLARLVDQTVRGLAPTAELREIRLVNRVEGPARLVGEGPLLRRAVENLIQNGIDFSPPGGRVELTLERTAEHLALVVSDQGAGVPDYARERVFQRFYSLPRPGTGRKSSGLGLVIAREAALLHGGSIRLENYPDRGARAILTLALSPP